MDACLRIAEEARLGLAEAALPIGAALAIEGRVVGRGHNRRVQRGSSILHAKMDCLENAGRLRARDYQRATLYSTLSPCDMCGGAALLYKIPRIVIGDFASNPNSGRTRSFRGARKLQQVQGPGVVERLRTARQRSQARSSGKSRLKKLAASVSTPSPFRHGNSLSCKEADAGRRRRESL